MQIEKIIKKFIDMETLALTLVTALATKAFEKLGENTAESVWNKVKDLMQGEELITLNLLEKYPDNEDLQNEVVEKLQPHLEENPEIAKELEKLLNQIPSIQIKQNTVSQSGDSNIAIQDTSESKITIQK